MSRFPLQPPTPLSPHGDTGSNGRAGPRVTILGVGQMGLVCSGILLDPDRGSASRSASPRPRVTLWGHSPEEVGAIAQTRRSERLPGFHVPDSVHLAFKDDAPM